MIGSLLWGDEPGRDFWTAVKRGQVSAPERRAMDLLFEMADEGRASLYCGTGALPAKGNVTGRIYLINRRGGIDELRDGHVVWNWCIAIDDPDVPKTDSVIALMQMIEHDELEFRRVGNRFGPTMSPGRPLGFSNPFHASFLGSDDLKSLECPPRSVESDAFGLSVGFSDWTGTMYAYNDEFDEWFESVSPKCKKEWCSRCVLDEYEIWLQEHAGDYTAAYSDPDPGLPWI